MTSSQRISVFVESEESIIFAKAILKTKRTKYLEFHRFINSFPGFNDAIFLDGCSDEDRQEDMGNFLSLPGGDNIERLLARFLFNLSDFSPIWDSIVPYYSKQLCFKGYSGLKELLKSPDKAKRWFNEQKLYWGRNASKVINPWMEENKDSVNRFLQDFDKILEKIKTNQEKR